MRTPLALLVLSLCVIAGTWIWLGEPVSRARAPLDPAQKLECVSYTPFRGAQSPLVQADWLIRCQPHQPALGTGTMVRALAF